MTFGIDVGGSGIKGAPVDLETGQLSTERYRIPTPQPSTPESVVEVISDIVTNCNAVGPIGCTFPGVVQNGVVRHAVNFDAAWEGLNAQELLRCRLGLSIQMLNDADAAGIAEMQFGAGRDFRDRGVVLLLTFGTGIGSSIFLDGQLLPNTELGSLELDGHIAELRAAGRLREGKILSWKKWIKRVQRYLSHVEILFSPDLIIFGGGISELSKRFLPKLETKTTLVPAQLQNNAGIVGAAMAAHRRTNST